MALASAAVTVARPRTRSNTRADKGVRGSPMPCSGELSHPDDGHRRPPQVRGEPRTPNHVSANQERPRRSARGMQMAARPPPRAQILALVRQGVGGRLAFLDVGDGLV